MASIYKVFCCYNAISSLTRWEERIQRFLPNNPWSIMQACHLTVSTVVHLYHPHTVCTDNIDNNYGKPTYQKCIQPIRNTSQLGCMWIVRVCVRYVGLDTYQAKCLLLHLTVQDVVLQVYCELLNWWELYYPSISISIATIAVGSAIASRFPDH